jgi:hypothetical protein
VDLFGQIEAAAAEYMLARHGSRMSKIAPERIPDTARVNDDGDAALFAILIPRDLLAEFETVIAKLRA